MQYNANFQPSCRRGSITERETVLEAYRELGVDIEVPCGGSSLLSLKVYVNGV